MPSQQRQLDGLTGLRAIAAAWVVIFHYDVGAFHPLHIRAAVPLVHAGYLGVDLFFVLSGFVIWHVHGREFVRPRLGSFGRFMCLRAARLYPVHLFTLGLLAAMVWLLPAFLRPPLQMANYTPRLLVLNLALLQSWGLAGHLAWNFPSWSVSAEWFCYLLFPLLAVLAARTGRRGTVAGIVLLMATSGLLLLTCFGNSMNQAVGAPALLRAGPEFLLGCLLRRFAGQAALDRWPWSAILAGALAAWVASVQAGLPIGLLAVPCFAALILAASTPGTPAGAWLAARPLLAVGAASYSLYLMQFPVEKAASGLRPYIALAHPWQSAGVVAFYLALLALATWAVHRWVENPSRRWLRQRIDARLPSAAAPRAALSPPRRVAG
jgi:acyltransferase